MKALVFSALLTVTVGSALARQVQEHDRYIPLVRDGGGWTTRITLVNLGTKPTGFDLLFHPETGYAGQWKLGLRAPGLTVAGSGVTGTLKPGTVAVVETTGEGEASLGFASLLRFGDELIAAEALLRNSATGETFTLSLSPAREDKLVLPFDNTGGRSTSFAWLSETDFAVLDAVAYDTNGRELVRHTLEFYAKDKLALHVFDTAEKFPALKDQSGVVVIEMSYPTVGFYDESTFAAAAIQRLPGGGLVATPSLSERAWAPRRY